MAVGRAIVAFEARDRQLQAVAKRSTATLKRFGAAAAATARAVAASFAVAAAVIGGAVALFVRAAIKQEDAEAKLAAVLKATGHAAGLAAEQLYAQAAALQKVTVYGDEVIMGTQAILATFKAIKGDMFKRATEAILDMATVMGQDAKASAIMLGKALNDPILGVTALTRTGVQFTKSQKDMIRSLQESGDLLAAQNIILVEVESQFGGAARAAGETFGGQLKKLWARLGDVAEKIGTILIPSLKRLAASFEGLAGILESLTDVQLYRLIVVAEHAAAALVILYTASKIGAANLAILGAAAWAALGPFGPLVAIIYATVAALGALAYWLHLSAKESEAVGRVYEEVSKKLSKLAHALRDARKQLEEARGTGEIDEQIAALKKVIVTREGEIANLVRLQKTHKDDMRRRAALSAAIARVRRDTTGLRIELKKLEDANKSLTKSEDGRKEELEDAAKRQKAINETYARGVAGIKDLEDEITKLTGTEEERARVAREEIVKKFKLEEVAETPRGRALIDVLLEAQKKVTAEKEKQLAVTKEIEAEERGQIAAAAELAKEMEASFERASAARIKAAEETLRLAEEALAAEKEKEHVARWESLAGLGRRIQAAAASVRADPRYQAAVDAAKAALRGAIAGEKSQKLLDDIAKILLEAEMPAAAYGV